jgi:hypothetical protein
MYTEVIYQLEQELPRYVVNAGELTDELESNQVGASPGALLGSSVSFGGSLDERILPEIPSVFPVEGADDYERLQGVRGSIAQAMGALVAYDTVVADTTNVKIMRGELYALRGYTELLLANLFCSGVPLSTFDFHGDFTYHTSSTTVQVYQDALVQADSAFTLADTSTQVRNLARVLRGRAFLDVGQYDSAAAAVSSVPDGFQYQLAASWNYGNSDMIHLYGNDSLSDQEGFNGLPYLSSNDPRTTDTVAVKNGKITFEFPSKYKAGLAANTFAPFTVADWIEARLIQAEAALHAGDPATMIGLLNHLRETARVTGQTVALADTTDPGTDSARVSLLFRERAFWMYFTGHRQEDLRRLIRQYGRPQDQVYPTGPYTAPGAGVYGNDVTVSIPATERVNPSFHGCLNRDA